MAESAARSWRIKLRLRRIAIAISKRIPRMATMCRSGDPLFLARGKKPAVRGPDPASIRLDLELQFRASHFVLSE